MTETPVRRGRKRHAAYCDYNGNNPAQRRNGRAEQRAADGLQNMIERIERQIDANN